MSGSQVAGIAAAPTRATDLRPLSTGELIDRGFTLYRQNFAGLFLLALLSQIAPLATSTALMTAVRVVPSPGSLQSWQMIDLPHTAALVAVWVLSQLITFAFGAIMTSYLADAYLGQRPSIGSAFARYRTVWWPALLTSLLNMALLAATLIFPFLALAAGMVYYMFFPPRQFTTLVLDLIGTMLLFVAAVAPLLIVFMRLMLTIPAVALESLKPLPAVKRSAALVRYDPGLGFMYWGEMRLSILLLPLFVIELLALVLTSLPAMLHEINEALMHGSIGQISAPPEAAVILSQILVLLSGSLLLPLYLIAMTLFYFDVRIRREGFDLEHMSSQARERASA